MAADARLTAILAALDRFGEAAVISPERSDEILRARAAIAASAREEVGDPELRLLAFVTGGALFGVPLESVSAITLVRAMTLLPGVPDAFAGLLNVRGRHITALDLTVFLDTARGAASQRRIVDAGKAITLLHEGREIALVAEELAGIHELYAREVRQLEGARAGAPVRSIGPDGIQIIDVSLLFQDLRLRGKAKSSPKGPLRKG